ncbi:putative capK protein [Clostridium perfringens ATCC 13124]|uniref:CapK protein n=1 Tax=Clostridium perfringens (strain ATCC 13124 / DSM 756 / JCM 1290 / NCIMB 6125 / NCTC 8237 / Type A) TaxID=195103 RepID=A0A0H2YU85_CLOP1|nr:phenylacetate--CoA ligase family protein [Clostridium perfringens]ABG84639.1 putative capK protein [Clostridium perfringens ATCC 13124]
MYKSFVDKIPEIFFAPLEFLNNKIFKKLIKSRKYKKIYKNTINEIKRFEIMNSSEIEEFSFKKLKKLLIYAFENVPYYNNLFNSINFNPNYMKNISEIKKIPLLDKRIINENYNNLISNEFKNNKSKLIKLSTGGSTGKPLEFLSLKYYNEARENAFIDYIFSKNGYKKDMRTIILRGDKVRNIDKKKAKNIYWRKKRGTNDLIMSTYMLNDVSCIFYIKKLIKYKAKCIKAYPSALELLANKMISMNLKNKDVELIICASENLSCMQIDIFKKVFCNAKIFDFYGHTEHCCLAELNNKNKYTFIPNYGYVELEENDDGSFEIVCSGYNNYVMPFIRYKTGDLVKDFNFIDGKLEVNKIEGRKKEYIIDKLGNKIVFTGSYKILDCVINKILAGQIIQENIGHLYVDVIVNEKFEDNDKNSIILAFKSKYKDRFDVDVRIVKELRKTSRGKINFFIQCI